MSFPIYLLQAVAFLDLFAVGLIMPLLILHVRQMGASHIYVGALGSVYSGFQLGSGPLIGSLSDFIGRKTILIMTLLVCGVTYTITGITTSFVIILATRAILGLFKQTQLLTRSLVPEYEFSEQKQSAIYGRMAGISVVGITLGPVVGGHIAEDYPENGFAMVAMAVGICFATNAGILYFLPKTELEKNRLRKRPTRKKPRRSYSGAYISIDKQFNSVYFAQSTNTNTKGNSIVSVKQSAIELYKIDWSDYWDVFLLIALMGFAMGVYDSNYALYLKTQYELTPKSIGYVISLQGVIGSTSSYFVGFINSFYGSDEDYTLRNLHVFILLSISLIGLILSFNIYVYMMWLIPLAVGNAVGRLVTSEMILKRCDVVHRETMIGASNSVRSLSGVVAPMVAGFIGHYCGVSYVIYASLLSALLGLILSYRCRNPNVKELGKED